MGVTNLAVFDLRLEVPQSMKQCKANGTASLDNLIIRLFCAEITGCSLKERPDEVDMIFNWENVDVNANLPAIVRAVMEHACVIFPHASITASCVQLPNFDAVSAARWIQFLPDAVRETIVHTFMEDSSGAIQKMIIRHTGPDLKIKSKL